MGTKDKTKKFRGSRTCGGGTHKNRRGAGNRGGRGHAGGCKHHFLKELMLGRGYGDYGFKRPQKVIQSVPVVDVGVLDEIAETLVQQKKAKVRTGKYYITIDDGKVLGAGQVNKPLIVTASSFSGRAVEKLEAAGGKAKIAE
ncbi:MAG: 50S ribosomal protein L15 [Euryarchaeota archaeon]|nr:50S ribosomal protein L15 [Euryarchaeota archaeon]